MGRMPSDTISPESTCRRLERKLQRRRSEDARRQASSELRQAFWRDGHEADVSEVHAWMHDLGMEPPLYAESITDAVDLKRYVERNRSLYEIVDLNAHEAAFDHMASTYLHAVGEAGGIGLVSGTGTIEILSPPRTGRFSERAAVMAWEKGEHAVVLSPEEQTSWDATDGRWWRMRHDYGTPRWRKILPTWRKPDLSMTAALREIAHRNAWEAHLLELDGKPIDYAGKLSYELRDPVPASTMVTLPTRVARRVRDVVLGAYWRFRYRHVIYPRQHGSSMVILEPGLAVHVCEFHSSVVVDSIGPGSHDVHLTFSRGRHGGPYRWERRGRCEITNTKTGRPVDTDTAMRMIGNLEWIIGRMERKPWPRWLLLPSLLLAAVGYAGSVSV